MELTLDQKHFVKNCYITFNKDPANHIADNITPWKNRWLLPPH